jgi:ATP/maltotriose-dependent transcriptional regulator MalT
MALFDYRSGELDAALHWIEKSQSLPLSPRPAQLTASCQILTAMIRVQQDRIDDARALLNPARSAIENWQAAPFNIGTTTDLWFDWVNARILLQEAQTLLPPT